MDLALIRVSLQQIPKQVLTRAEQSLKERCQKICEQADRLHDDAQMASDYMARNKILHKRLITTGKSLGECLADAAKMKSYAVAENIFDSYKQRFSAKVRSCQCFVGSSSSRTNIRNLQKNVNKESSS
uniref:Uncharacterized protein n=1 Tax=Spongospora subterranea TaxID=70186 RepID=A0A0H5RA90_9EUKA|eukprot:CRZ05334.1 hypothetical protein [Spongospora subterranea]